MPDIFVAPSKNAAPANVNPQASGDSAPQVNKDPNQNAADIQPISETNPLLSVPVKRPIHLFSSFSKDPEGVCFQNQEPDENVLLLVRKDLITNVPWLVIGLLLLILPLFVGPINSVFHISLPFLPMIYFLFFTLFYYLFALTYIFVNFITWYFNVSLVTNIRIMDVDFSNLVYKNVSATKIDLVQDVSYSQIGVVRTFFDYGDVLVQTAGTLDNFIFSAVPQPENVVHIIEDIIGKEERL